MTERNRSLLGGVMRHDSTKRPPWRPGVENSDVLRRETRRLRARALPTRARPRAGLFRCRRDFSCLYVAISYSESRLSRAAFPSFKAASAALFFRGRFSGERFNTPLTDSPASCLDGCSSSRPRVLDHDVCWCVGRRPIALVLMTTAPNTARTDRSPAERRAFCRIGATASS
jgi:hypothetical protein